MQNTELCQTPRAENIILVIRGRRVIVDADLARLYGVTTAALNQAVRRNAARFPVDFAFQLTPEEKKEVITNCDHLGMLKFSKSLPMVFTEYGAVMAASIINSEAAIRTSVFVVRAFIEMRHTIAAGIEIGLKLKDLEHRVDGHDRELSAIVEEIRLLVSDAKSSPTKTIGFHPRDDSDF
jgi:hypothetical protein